MARPASKHPTELELEILKRLWEGGRATVRDVRDRLAGFRELAYTSVQTVMNIMVEKGYLDRAKDGPSYVYAARVSRRRTARRMLADLVSRVFDGSATAAVARLLETADLDGEELAELRRLVDEKLEEKRS